MINPFGWLDQHEFSKSRIIECFLYFDEPILFLMELRSSELLLVDKVDSSAEKEAWIASPVSTEEILHLGAGSIDFFTAFVGDGNKDAMRINVPASGEIEIVSIPSRDLLASELPIQGARIPPQFLTDVKRAGANMFRAVVRLTGEAETALRPTPKTLASVLEDFQTAIELGVARVLGRDVRPRGRLDQVVLGLSQMQVVGFAPGSFGIVLDRTPDNEQAPALPDVAAGQQYPIDQSFEALAALLGHGEDRDALVADFRELGARYAIAYRRLLEGLAAAHAGFALEWATPQRAPRSQIVSPADVPRVLAAVQSVFEEVTREEQVTWILIRGIHATRDRFWMVDPDDPSTDRDVEGRFAEALRNRPISLGAYRVRLESKVSTDEVTGAVKKSWTLLDILEAGEDAQSPYSS